MDDPELVTADARELAAAAADTMVQSLIQQDTKFGDDFAEHIRHFLDEGADQSLPEGVARAMIQEVRFLLEFVLSQGSGRPSGHPFRRFHGARASGRTFLVALLLALLISFPWFIYHTPLNLGFISLSRAFHIWS